MPSNDDKRQDPKLAKQLDSIQDNIDGMYKATYYNTSLGTRHLDALNRRINTHIDKITNFNLATTGVPSISRLYSRMKLTGDDEGIGEYKDITELFNNAIGFEDFYSNFMSNRYLVEVDAEIDAVCKYFPELLEALEVKKEGVLSADHFSKDYLTVKHPDGDDEDIFAERIKELKERYNLLELVDEIYDDTAKYGEYYLYIVPYSTAISKLLEDKPKTMANQVAAGTPGGFTLNDAAEFRLEDDGPEKLNVVAEHYDISLSGDKFIIKEDGQKIPLLNETVTIQEFTTNASGKKEAVDSPLLPQGQNFNIKLTLNYSGILEDTVLDTYRYYSRKKPKLPTALSEEYLHEKGKPLAMVAFNKNNGKMEIKARSDQPDGLVDPNEEKDENNEYKVDIPGCVVNKIKREQVIPLYLQGTDKCLGYYYIELRSVEAMQDFQGYNYMMSDSLTSIRGSNSGMNAPFNVVDPTRQEHLLQYLSGQLSKFIDKEFVQTNQDLAEEIYMILKQNDLFNTPSIDEVKVTFVPPEDIIHFYFKLDKDTHRGISDLEKAIIPAKLYACMYITDAIAQMVRGQDKRVFYVRQNVETNISQTLMNTIMQIKQGNFGLRQFSNINNVLNITGKFNDFIVPTSPGGESPVQIEVLQGQQFTDNSERLNALKEMAINSTDVPFEIIQTRQSVDYAMQLSMSSSRFLRKIYHRQGQFVPFLNRLITKLYNFQYKEQESLEVTLPAPMFLNMANTNQLVENIKQFIQTTTEFETNNMGEEEELKNIYMQELFKFYVGTHVELEQHEKILKEARLKYEQNKKPSEEEEQGGY